MNKLVLLLTGCALVGCAHAIRDGQSTVDTYATMQPPIRVIIYFNQTPAADRKKVAAVISEACRCHAVFFRRYGRDTLIYEISLPQNYTFASFEKALRAGGMSQGIQAVEQDMLMRHQQ